MAQGQERNHPDWILKLLRHLLLQFYISPKPRLVQWIALLVVRLPEPSQIIMRQHDTLRLIRTAREHNVATHVRPLVFDTPHDHSVLNLVAQCQRLAPIINLDVAIEVTVLG